MNQTTLERLTLINTGLLVIVVWKVFFAVDNSSSSIHTMSVEPIKKVEPLTKPGEPSRNAPRSGGGAQNYAELLEQTIEPLERAFAEHGEEPVLPSDEQLAAAIATNDLRSEPSKKVLEMLDAGYSQYNMPFPKLEIPAGDNRAVSAVAPVQNEAPENQQLPNYGEWLRRTADNLDKVIREKKEARTGLIPTEQELQAAVESGDPLSEQSRLAIDMLKNGYARFKMDFPSYGTSEKNTATTQDVSKSVQQKVSQKRILKAYFQGQVQRLTTEANSKSIDITADLPQQEQVDQAVESGTLQSEPSKQVLEKIEGCYTKLGLTFYRPPSQ